MSNVSDRDFWQDRSTLVTGAAGFVGGRLVRQLMDLGADLVCLVRDWAPKCELVRGRLIEEVNVVRGDVRDREVIERTLGEYEVETVVHLAAQTVVPVANRNPVSTFETNVAGTWHLLEGCRRSPKVAQIVVASSDKAYGEQAAEPYREGMPLQARHPYDVSKSCADLIAQAYAATYELPVVISRCGNLYGGGDLNWSRIVPGTVRSILRRKRPVIRSDGKSVRDYLYVDDGATAYVLLAERLAQNPGLRGEAFNFSNGEPMTVLDLTHRVLSLMGSTLEPDVRNQATGEIRHQSLDTAKARSVLGWRPRYTLDEGLRRTIEWYRTFLERET